MMSPVKSLPPFHWSRLFKRQTASEKVLEGTEILGGFVRTRGGRGCLMVSVLGCLWRSTSRQWNNNGDKCICNAQNSSVIRV